MKNNEKSGVMRRVLVCTLVLLILFPQAVLALKTVKPATQGNYLDLLPTPTEKRLFNMDVYLGIEDKNRETDAEKYPYPELIADASDGDADTDAAGDDDTDSDDDADSDADTDKGNDALTPSEQ